MRRSALIVCLLALCACNPAPSKTAPTAAPSPTATALSLRISGHGTAKAPVRFVQQRNNRVVYELVAASFVSVGPQGSTQALFHDARVVFHSIDGATVTAIAPQALVDEKANTVTMRGGVHARNASGMRLNCRNLVYDQKTGMLDGTGDVTMDAPNGFHATGSSVVSDVSLTHVRMK